MSLIYYTKPSITALEICYATDAATASKARPELQAFSKVLPPRVRLTVYGPATNAAE